MAVNMYDARLTSAMIALNKNVSDRGIAFYFGCIDGNSKVGKITESEWLYLRGMILKKRRVFLDKTMHSAKEVSSLLRQDDFSSTIEGAYVYGLAFGSFGVSGFDEKLLRQVESAFDEDFLDEADMILFGEYEE